MIKTIPNANWTVSKDLPGFILPLTKEKCMQIKIKLTVKNGNLIKTKR